MTVFHRPNDVLGTECRVAAEKYFRPRRLVGDRVDLGHIPFIQFDADSILDPRESVLLADGEYHIVAGNEYIAQRARGLDVAILDVVFQLFEHHARQLATLDHKGFRRMIDDYFDALALGILQLPFGGLEELARLSR